MSLWSDLDSIARFNLVQDLSATGWFLVSNSIDYQDDQVQPIFLAPDGSLRYLDGGSAPLPVSVNSGGWTDPNAPSEGGIIGLVAGELSRQKIILLMAAAGVVVLIALRKKG